jgi:hypothetical protein
MIGAIDLVAAGVAGGAAGGLAQSGRSFFHDALRPLAHELRSGSTSRGELARYGWGVSYRFIAWAALPFAALTGVTVSFLIFLPADIIGIRLRSRVLAPMLAAATSVGFVAGASWVAQLLSRLTISITAALPALVGPVLWLYPLIPAVAAMKLNRPRAGAVAVLGTTAGAAAIAALAGAQEQVSAAAAGAGLFALLGVHVLPALRQRRAAAPELAADRHHVRSALPLLALTGAGCAVLAQRHRLAGEPLATLLIGRGHAVDAAIVALMTAAAFFPLVAVSSVAADSYSTQGTPDWILAAGYLLPLASIAAAVGAVLMSLEVLLSRRSCRLVMRTPALSETAAAIREAMVDVMNLALLVGGLALGGRLGGPVGFAAVGAAWALNEGLGKPVMRLAVGPSAALLVGLCANLWMQIK